MKKKSIILLLVACLLSLCIFSGLLVYAFQLQAEKDRQSQSNGQGSNTASDITPTEVPEDSEGPETGTSGDVDSDSASATPSPSITITAAPTDQSDSGDTTAPSSDQPSQGTSGDADQTGKPIILTFAGDVNLDEASYPSAKYDKEKKGILGGLSSDLLKEMTSADIMMLNNEFSYSLRGTKTPDKSYTFRADPKRVSILNEMGVDIVSLANNHALDYGPDALEDTFKALDDAGIDYIGAGDNLDRAKAPIYYTVGDKRIAYVAASHVVFSMDWYASDSKLGMIGTYDPALFLESIKEAAANSDFVVAFLHWGVERKDHPEVYQRNLAKLYIDAGADLVVGCHPHVLQGFEFYKGKPIAYSLGNFWFNNSTGKTGLLKLYLNEDGSSRIQMLPAATANTYTSLIKDNSKKEDYINYMESISYGVSIDPDGFITEKINP